MALLPEAAGQHTPRARLAGLWLFAALASGCDYEMPLEPKNLYGLQLFSFGEAISLSFNNRSPPGCPTFSRVRARQNGVELEQLEPGGKDPYSGYCEHPRWKTAPVDPSEAATTFVLDDGRNTVTAEFQFLAAVRTVRVVSPANATARVGDPVALEWWPNTDDLSQNTRVEFLWGDRRAGMTLNLAVDGPQLTFAVENNPSYPATTTAGTLSVSAALLAPVGVSRCEGVTSCKATIEALGSSIAQTPFTLER